MTAWRFMAGAVALGALLSGPAWAGNDSKNISDGAAKGQASERTISPPSPSGGSGQPGAAAPAAVMNEPHWVPPQAAGAPTGSASQGGAHN